MVSREVSTTATPTEPPVSPLEGLRVVGEFAEATNEHIRAAQSYLSGETALAPYGFTQARGARAPAREDERDYYIEAFDRAFAGGAGLFDQSMTDFEIDFVRQAGEQDPSAVQYPADGPPTVTLGLGHTVKQRLGLPADQRVLVVGSTFRRVVFGGDHSTATPPRQLALCEAEIPVTNQEEETVARVVYFERVGRELPIEAQVSPVSSAFEELEMGMLDAAEAYLGGLSDGAPTGVVYQRDALSDDEMNERNHFLAIAETRLGIDAANALAEFEESDKSRDGYGTVRLEPWMLPRVGLSPEDHEGSPVYVHGVVRGVRCNFEGQPPLVLHEIEIPRPSVDPEIEETKQAVTRFIWFKAI